MIHSIVRLLIAFPQLGKLFLQVKDEYTKVLAQRRAESNRERINRWVHDEPPTKQAPRDNR